MWSQYDSHLRVLVIGLWAYCHEEGIFKSVRVLLVKRTHHNLHRRWDTSPVQANADMNISDVGWRAEIAIRGSPIAGNLIITSLRDGHALRIICGALNEQPRRPQVGEPPFHCPREVCQMGASVH